MSALAPRPLGYARGGALPAALGTVLLALQAFGLASAGAQNVGPAPGAEAPQAPETVAFAQRGPLIIDLARLRKAGALRVELVNLLSGTQTVSVGVLGLEQRTRKLDPSIANLFPAPEDEELEPRTFETVSIRATKRGSKPNEKSYEGVIVAVGESGPVARRQLVVKVDEEPTDPPPVPTDGALSPEGLSDVSLSATNFAPSLLSPLGPGLLALGAVALLAPFLMWDTLGRRQRWVLLGLGVGTMLVGARLGAFGERGWPELEDEASLVLVVLASFLAFSLLATRKFAAISRSSAASMVGCVVALLLAAVFVNSYDGMLPEGPNANLISTKPVAVTQSVPNRVGVVSDGEGDLAGLQVTESGAEGQGSGQDTAKGAANDQNGSAGRSQLDVEGVTRAGTYRGDIDLNGSEEGGSAKATVNVRDWWLWPFLALALGVGLGYLVRNYFDRTRPVSLARARLNDVWRRVMQADSASQQEAGSRPYRELTMVQRAQAWVSHIQGLLTEHQVDEAEKQRSEFEVYADEFQDLRWQAGRLHLRYQEMEYAYKAFPFGVARADVKPLTKAHTAMGDPTDKDYRDAKKVLLSEQGKAVSDAKDLLLSVFDLHDRTSELYLEAVMLQEEFCRERRKDDAAAADEEKCKQAKTCAEELNRLGSEILTADNLSEVEPYKKDLDDLTTRLSKLGKEAFEATQVDEDYVRRSYLLEMHAGEVRAIQQVEAAGLSNDLEQEAQLNSSVASPTGKAATWRGDADDLYMFEATVPASPQAGEVDVEWNFGTDGETLKQRVPVEERSAVAKVRHQFAGDKPEADISLNTNLLERVSGRAQIGRPGRAEQARSRFGVRDREMTLLAGLLAVGSGMLTLYFADAAWGVPKDYLEAALWGGVVAQGVTLVGQLVKRLWGPAS